MKNKTVTVGIPAHNEEHSIQQLLLSVLAQEGNFTLEKILVYCDGCSDKTAAIAKRIARKDERIIVVDGKEQMGKAARLNQIFKANNSDVLVLFDADIILQDLSVIHNLVRRYTTKKVGVVSSNNLPRSTGSFLSTVMETAEELWYEARKDFQNGDHIYNNSGCAFSLSRELASVLSFPPNLVADHQFVYLEAKKRKMEFVFAEDACVYYFTPATLTDITKQLARSDREDDFLVEFFGEELDQICKIPLSYKTKAIVRMLHKKPVMTLVSPAILKLLLIIPKPKNRNIEKGIWEQTSSTKKVFSTLK